MPRLELGRSGETNSREVFVPVAAQDRQKRGRMSRSTCCKARFCYLLL